MSNWYIRRPSPFQAEQIFSRDKTDPTPFVMQAVAKGCFQYTDDGFIVKHGNSSVKTNYGDYLVLSPLGYYYACDRNAFENGYVKAD